MPNCTHPASRRARVCLALVLLVFLPVAGAGPLILRSGTQQVTLVELYTSQGCSSCPPAERWLNAYTTSPDLWTRIVPIAFHVDYWDDLGWADPYASAANSERQRDHARHQQSTTVYTPGLFVNGRAWRGWVYRLPLRHSDREPGELVVTLDNGRFEARYTAAAGADMDLHVAILGGGIDTAVERGENRNRTLHQEFVALAHERFRSADGRWRAALPCTLATAPRYAIALWVSKADEPTPVQATGGWLADAGSCR
jgi:hypothetical protein